MSAELIAKLAREAGIDVYPTGGGRFCRVGTEDEVPLALFAALVAEHILEQVTSETRLNGLRALSEGYSPQYVAIAIASYKSAALAGTQLFPRTGVTPPPTT